MKYNKLKYTNLLTSCRVSQSRLIFELENIRANQPKTNLIRVKFSSSYNKLKFKRIANES
jgi:hypothetical protein